MKRENLYTIACLLFALAFTGPAQTGDLPAANKQAEEPAPAKGDNQPPPRSAADRTEGVSASSVAPGAAPDPDKPLRINFRGVPLEMVLNYLSEAAGFLIVLETEVKGKVDAWSNQPLSKDEAVDLLNSVLHRNGYAAIRNGKILTIVSRDAAKKRDIPVRSGADPEAIPRNDEMVTQIIPVRYANATQLTKDLQPLLPSEANLTANESGNALVLTDTQSNIRRMAEIVQALDTSISSISAIRVFPLRFADAKELANVVKELFEAPTANQRGGNNDRRAEFFSRFGGGGFPGGGPGGPGGGGGAAAGGATGNNSEARRAASRVVAVADERINALVVSAPDEFIPTIEQLVREIDTNVADVTELRVFHLANADPIEMADVLMDLFPDDTSGQDNRGQVQFNRGGFGGFGGGGGRGGGNQASSPSQRLTKQSRVIAVPDARTASIIVSAARDLMNQIAQMVAQLDVNPAKKQKVFVYTLENADVQNVEEILRNMFEGDTTRNTRSTGNQNNNPLNNRTTQNQGANGGGFGGNRGGGGGQGDR